MTTLGKQFRILRQQWYVFLILAALCLAGAAALTAVQTPKYAATTKMFVSVGSSSTASSAASQGGTSTQQLVKSYAYVVRTPEMLIQVIARLGLKTTSGRLASEISVHTPKDTVVLVVTVKDASPQRAADVANAIAARFPTFVTTLQSPAEPGTSPVKITVLADASASFTPVSPDIPLNLALGLLVGIVLGVLAALLRGHLNTSITSIAEIEELTGSVPLGVLPFDAETPKKPLIDGDQQQGQRAEAFKTLRTNLQFADVDDPPQVMVVTSPLPSEGKTTTACNIAISLAQGGSRVILIDGDLRAPMVSAHFGISRSAGLSTVLAGHHQLSEVIVPSRSMPLALLPSGPTPPNPSELLGSQHMVDLLLSLANHYDTVIIDAPPLLPVTDAAVLTAEADGAIMVVRYGQTRREVLARAMQALATVNGRLLGTVMNFAPKRMDKGAYAGYEYGYGPRSPGSRRPRPTDESGALPLAELIQPPSG